MMIAVVGPQGSGKGTQAKLLAEKYGLRHISMGAVLREIASQGLPESVRIAGYLEKGILVPDEDIILALTAYLGEKDLEKGVIFDGAPRNRQQLELIESTLKESFRAAIFINISEQETLQRLSGRLVCQNCGANYNLLTKKPCVEGVCDDCGGVLGRRHDETSEAIKKRLQVYRQQTAPLLKIYQRRQILIEIAGEQPIEVIHQEIVARLKKAEVIE